MVGSEASKGTADLLEHLHPDSMATFLCGPSHSKASLGCKTSLVVEILKGIVALRNQTNNRSGSVIDVKKGLSADSTALKRDVWATKLYGRDSTLKFRRDRIPKWYCTFDDDVYAHPDRIAEYLQGHDESIPQTVGPFCSLPTSCCHNNEGVQNFGSNSWQWNPAAHTCGSLCWSRGLIEAALQDDKGAVPVDISGGNSNSGSCKRMIAEDEAASRILPNSTFDFRLWQDTNHRCYAENKPDDILMADWTQPPRVHRTDLPCFLCEYYAIEQGQEEGRGMTHPGTLQAYTFMFHFTAQFGGEFFRLAGYHNDTYPNSHSGTKLKNRKLLKGRATQCPLRRGCDEEKCANYFEHNGADCCIQNQCVQPIRSNLTQNGGHLCQRSNVPLTEKNGKNMHKTLALWKPLEDDCKDNEQEVGS